jgi:cytochrome c
MKAALVGMAAAAFIAAGAVNAGEPSGAELVKAKGCLNCHDMDKKKVGPSFKDIAAKGKDTKQVATALKEGKGHMKVNASDAEVTAMLQYINSQK